MAEEISNTPGPFDVSTIKALIRMMTRHNMNEVDLRQGESRIRLVRGLPNSIATVVSQTPMALPPAPIPTTESSSSNPAPSKETRPLYEIKSPTPGTFYSSASPDAEPYVRVGSKVNPSTVVCLIEAMKLFTEIQAEVSGVIAEILVQNQQPVEYGTVLFRVDTGA